MAVGGDILEITYNHPTLGNGTIFPKADEDSTFDLGGFRSADDDAGVDGSGSPITTMSRKRWSAEATVAWDMNNRNELEKLVALAEHPVETTFTISHINGSIYGGKGRPVGDLKGAGKGATFPLKISGGGKLNKIA